MNNLNIKPIKDGDTYKYLGIDKNINYVGTLNKERVMKYLTRVKKIWQSELSSMNKVIAHNTFAIPVLTTTVVKEIDVRTRKQLAMTGNFHPKGDVDKLYLPRLQGGRELKMVPRIFESRVIKVGQYLTINGNSNKAITFVYEKEQQNIF